MPENKPAERTDKQGSPPCDSPHKVARFWSVVASYTFGNFNENFFKEAAMLMAVSSGKTYLQGLGTVIFTAPYLLFAAGSGWLSDRFRKGHVMIGAKLLEMFSMTAGALGLLLDNWALVIMMGALMATHSTIFSPAINGSIPEIFEQRKVNRVNAAVKFLAMAAIFVGIALAGLALGKKGQGLAGASAGRTLVTFIAIGATILGVTLSLFGPRCPPADPQRRFPWTGPVDTVRRISRLRADPLLPMVTVTDAFMWSMGSLEILIINKMGVDEFHLGTTLTGMLVISQLVGFGAGGFLSGAAVNRKTGYRLFVPFTFVMALFMAAMPLAALFGGTVRLVIIIVLLLGMGAFGGMVLVPCESLVQIRAPAREKGAIIAAVNFVIFAGVMVSGPLSNLLNYLLRPTVSFAIMAGMAIILCVVLFFWLRAIRRKMPEEYKTGKDAGGGEGSQEDLGADGDKQQSKSP